MAHDVKAHADAIDWRGKADAVILNCHGDASGQLMKADADAVGLAMSDGVANGLLGDAEELSGRARIIQQDGLRQVEQTIDATVEGGAVSKLSEGGHEALHVEFHGGQSTSEGTGKINAILNHANQMGCCGGVLG
jgi:hypothetical protein